MPISQAQNYFEKLFAPYKEAAEKSPLVHESNAERLDAIKKRYAQCMQCPLSTQGRSRVVFGHGNATATLMFVGEGPGRDEDAQGFPFVGRAGKLLTTLINNIDLAREDVYISNTVKCRPPQNRTPLPNESATCISHILLKEIAIIRPNVICLLGAAATQALLGPETRLGSVRGKQIQTESFIILPTYHPAYLLRNPSATDTVKNDLASINGKI